MEDLIGAAQVQAVGLEQQSRIGNGKTRDIALAARSGSLIKLGKQVIVIAVGIQIDRIERLDQDIAFGNGCCDGGTGQNHAELVPGKAPLPARMTPAWLSHSFAQRGPCRKPPAASWTKPLAAAGTKPPATAGAKCLRPQRQARAAARIDHGNPA